MSEVIGPSPLDLPTKNMLHILIVFIDLDNPSNANLEYPNWVCVRTLDKTTNVHNSSACITIGD